MSSIIDSTTASDKLTRLYNNRQQLFSRVHQRLEFIKLILEGTDLDPLFDFDQIIDTEYCKTKDIRNIITKKTLVFRDVLKQIGERITYFKSGTTGHTFKGFSIPDPDRPSMSISYAIKVVAYPKEDEYGDINDPKRPENAEILMLRLLSYFVINDSTPHIVLPITTFNTKIFTFISLYLNKFITTDKYAKFVEKYYDHDFYDDVSILISEWADGSDLLHYLRNNFKKLTVRQWRVLFFQVISPLAVIQSEYRAFRHNDYKPNNILLEVITMSDILNTFEYTINNNKYYIPNIGLRCKIWDFDFACIPGLIENDKVNTEWTEKINVKPEAHPFYDVHYFFSTLTSRGFVDDFFGSDEDGIPFVPTEVTAFIRRIIPVSLQESKYISKRGRLLLSWEEMYKIPEIVNLTPEDIIMNDPFFRKTRKV
jgi:serine/threonine protein kinase